MLAHYARLAPLKTITEEFKAKAKAADRNQDTKLFEKKLDSLQRVVDSLVAKLDNEDLADADAVPLPSDDVYVLNCASDIWHLASVFNASSMTGTTVCKWQFTRHNAQTVPVAPFAARGFSFCVRCLPRLAVENSAQALSESSSSS